MNSSIGLKSPLASNAMRTILIVFILVIGAIKTGQWLLFTLDHSEFFQAYAALLFISVPYFYLRITHFDVSILGLRGDQVGKDIRAAVFTGLPIITSYVAAWLFYHEHLLGEHVVFQIKASAVLVIIEQACIVSLPEELFFRGFCQGMLSGKIRDNLSSYKTFVSLPVILPSVLFAAAHFLTEPQMYRLATFFPALLFGYMRKRYNSILPGVIIHAAANFAVYVLEGG